MEVKLPPLQGNYDRRTNRPTDNRPTTDRPDHRKVLLPRIIITFVQNAASTFYAFKEILLRSIISHCFAYLKKVVWHLRLLYSSQECRLVISPFCRHPFLYAYLSSGKWYGKPCILFFTQFAIMRLFDASTVGFLLRAVFKPVLNNANATTPRPAIWIRKTRIKIVKHIGD